MKRKLAALWALSAAVVITALVLTSATFAWFTANRKVGTDLVTTRAGTNTLSLQISRLGGDRFQPEPTFRVTLKALANPLMPVSTANLASFVYNPITVDDMAETFLPTQDESFYYHDTIYLRATGDGLPEDTKVDLYLDNTGTPIVESLNGELLTATRLGLTFNGAAPVIFALSNVNEGNGNTRLGGTDIGTGKVLSYEGGAVTAVNDPALSLTDAQVTTAGLPGARALARLELNKVYTVDIYFYLEGCDPDCTNDKVSLDTAALNLGFYALIAA